MIPLPMRYLEAENRMVAVRGWGKGERELVDDEFRVSVCKDKNVLEMDDGDGSTTLRISLILLN